MVNKPQQWSDFTPAGVRTQKERVHARYRQQKKRILTTLRESVAYKAANDEQRKQQEEGALSRWQDAKAQDLLQVEVVAAQMNGALPPPATPPKNSQLPTPDVTPAPPKLAPGTGLGFNVTAEGILNYACSLEDPYAVVTVNDTPIGSPVYDVFLQDPSKFDQKDWDEYAFHLRAATDLTQRFRKVTGATREEQFERQALVDRNMQRLIKHGRTKEVDDLINGIKGNYKLIWLESFKRDYPEFLNTHFSDNDSISDDSDLYDDDDVSDDSVLSSVADMSDTAEEA